MIRKREEKETILEYS